MKYLGIPCGGNFMLMDTLLLAMDKVLIFEKNVLCFEKNVLYSSYIVVIQYIKS